MSNFVSLENPSPGLDALTPREIDCLRVLAEGNSTQATASRLGIARSTIEKHLSSARAKLGVRTTRDALLHFVRRDPPLPAPRVYDAPELLDFATDLHACNSFVSAWAVYLRHAERAGASGANFGLVAEPPGQVTDGMRVLGMELPEELLQLYAEAGGAAGDSVMRRIALDPVPLNFDVAEVPPDLRGAMPRALQVFSDAFLDHGLRNVLGASMRDPDTGAFFAAPFTFSRDMSAELRDHETRFFALNRSMAAIFWAAIQERRLLASLVPITAREREALENVARGFSTQESAERMGMSQRSVEKLLARARAAFGAPTTPAAIYRAMVYRVLF